MTQNTRPPETQEPITVEKDKKRLISRLLIGLICAVPLFYLALQGWSEYHHSKQLEKETQEASQRLEERRKNASPVAAPENDEALFDRIEQTGNQSEMAIRLNYDEAIKRDLTCSRIMANRMAYFGVPVVFAGKIKRTTQNESNGKKNTSVAIEMIESDSTCTGVVIIAQCPAKPDIKEGEPGIVIGYLAMN